MSKPEINGGVGALLLVGRDYGETEARLGKPFQGTAGRILDEALDEAGIRRGDINITNVVNARPPGNDFRKHSEEALTQGLQDLSDLLVELKPPLVVTLGNEAAFALIEDWPTTRGSRRIQDASGIEMRRGYVWESRTGVEVLTTVHPAFVARSWVPWRVLLGYDLQRAAAILRRGGVERPKREVVVV